MSLDLDIGHCCRLCLSTSTLQSIFDLDLVEKLRKYLNIEVNIEFVYMQLKIYIFSMKF